MMKPTRPSVNFRLSATRTEEVEELLRRFYRAEVPHAWPAPPAVTPMLREAKQPRRLAIGRFFRVPTRLAIAASVALLVIGYITLQTWFPEPQATSGVEQNAPMSNKPGMLPPQRFPGSPVPKQASGAQQLPTPNPQHPAILPVDDLSAKKAK
jgi:hypothetical protein